MGEKEDVVGATLSGDDAIRWEKSAYNRYYEAHDTVRVDKKGKMSVVGEATSTIGQ